MEVKCGGTVKKRLGEPFEVEITFKNKGTSEGSWRIAVAFESDGWNWAGEQIDLALEPGERETLTWEGIVPDDAIVDSMARLIVYFDNEFGALNWWIQVLPGAELAIVDSRVS
jgi:hypothetical protein